MCLLEEYTCIPWHLCGGQREMLWNWLSFYLYMASRDWIQVTRQAPIPTESVSGQVFSNLRYSLKQTIYLATCLFIGPLYIWLWMFLLSNRLFSAVLFSLALVLRTGRKLADTSVRPEQPPEPAPPRLWPGLEASRGCPVTSAWTVGVPRMWLPRSVWSFTDSFALNDFEGFCFVCFTNWSKNILSS